MRLSISEGIVPNRSIGFIGTAGETYDDPYFVEDSRQRLRELGMNLVEIDVSNEPRETLVNIIDGIDALFVAGGNSFFLLHQLRNKKIDTYIARKVREGLPYFGESAGAIVLARSIEPATSIDNPEAAVDLKDYRGLQLLDFFSLPHAGREKYRVAFEQLIRDHEAAISIVQYRDDQAILTRDGVKYDILPSNIRYQLVDRIRK